MQKDKNKNKSYWKRNSFVHELINQIPAAIFWKNTESVFLGCNQYFAKLAALSSPEEIIGKTDYELPWSRAQSDVYRADDQAVIKSKHPKLGIEEPQTLSDGQHIVLLTSKIPLLKDGVVIGILGIYFDITDRKQMEEDLRIAKEQAEIASHAKTEFIANMSHDIRTPLTGIIGMAHLLEEEAANPTEKQHAQWVHESGEQLLGLLTDVLDVVSSDSANENDIHYETFDLYAMVHDVLALEQAAVKVHKLDLKLHIEGEVPHYVVSDRAKIHRVLLNLIGNAIKFTHKGYIGIDVKLISRKKEIAQIEFHVKDTGIGIPADLQDKVFERFFKVQPSYKGYTGHGLGLHIAEKFVELLGGSIHLTSQVGVGTTFSFVLPMKVGNPADCVSHPPVTQAQHHPNVRPQKIPEAPKLSSASKPAALQILLIEDNLIALQVLKSLVEGLPAQAYTAADAESALPLVKAQTFHLIITDIGLPGQSGDDLAKSIRAWEKSHNKEPTPIVGLTGHAIGDVSTSCLEAGMNKIYPKPMTAAVLKDIIHTFVKP